MKRLTVLCTLLFALTACGQGQTVITQTGTTSSDQTGSGTQSDPYMGDDHYYRLQNGTLVDCLDDNGYEQCNWGGQ